MPGKTHNSAPEMAATNNRLAEAINLQVIEGNPLSADEIAMLEMFEREGWSPERCRAHIIRRFKELHPAATAV